MIAGKAGGKSLHASPRRRRIAVKRRPGRRGRRSYPPRTNATGDFIEWRPGGQSGRRRLTFRYANGSASNRALQLSVNGDVVTNSLAFTPTGSWSTWREVSVEVNFEDSDNLVRLATVGNNGPNIDVLKIETISE